MSDSSNKNAYQPPTGPLDPAFAAEPINWTLLGILAKRYHPVVTEGWWEWANEQDGYQGEMAREHVISHHLLDLLGVPCPLPSVGGAGHPADLDARVWRAVSGALALMERLGRISDRHSRATGPSGTFDDVCTECGQDWPCETRQMADGTYIDYAAVTAPTCTTCEGRGMIQDRPGEALVCPTCRPDVTAPSTTGDTDE